MTRKTPLRRADALGGSALSAAFLLLADWFLALNLARAPSPGGARGPRIAIVQTLDATLPPPPSLLARLGRVLTLLGFADVFIGLPA